MEIGRTRGSQSKQNHEAHEGKLQVSKLSEESTDPGLVTPDREPATWKSPIELNPQPDYPKRASPGRLGLR